MEIATKRRNVSKSKTKTLSKSNKGSRTRKHLIKSNKIILIKHNNKNKNKNTKKNMISKKRKLHYMNKNDKIIKVNNFLQKYYVKSKYHLPMFHKIINKNGGGLLTNREEKEFYDNTIKLAESSNSNNSVIIEKHIAKILKVADNVVEKFESGKNKGKTIKILEVDKTIPKILENIKNYKEYTDISKPALNCITLQCVILFTELLRISDEEKFKKTQIFVETYDEIINIEWDDFNVVIKSNEIINTYNEPNVFLSLLGELSLFQIIESYAKDIYICGVTIDYIYADGKEHNPFDFMTHDLAHKYNRVETKYLIQDNFDAETEFISHIKTEYSNSNSEKRLSELYDIILVLFIIMHEGYGNENQLLKSNKNPITITAAESFSLLKDFEDINNLGGLLPDEFKNPEKTKIMETMYEEIGKYYDHICYVFEKEWNSFFKEYNTYSIKPPDNKVLNLKKLIKYKNS
jgi:hypothetical protein